MSNNIPLYILVHMYILYLCLIFRTRTNKSNKSTGGSFSEKIWKLDHKVRRRRVIHPRDIELHTTGLPILYYREENKSIAERAGLGSSINNVEAAAAAAARVTSRDSSLGGSEVQERSFPKPQLLLYTGPQPNPFSLVPA